MLSPEQKEQWQERIRLQQASGQRLSQWCREHQASYNAMLYWQKKLGLAPEKTLERSSFEELPPSAEDPTITITNPND